MTIMTPEQYSEIEESIKAGGQLTAEQAELLVGTINRLDGTVFVFQNALQMMADGVGSSVPQLAHKIMQRCGRTDMKIKKAIAEMAADTVGSITESIQQYLVACMLQLAETLNLTIEELIGQPDEQAEDEPTS